MPVRYLVPFHPKNTSHLVTDVLIIGGGLAGLRAALEIEPSLHVTILTKGELVQSNSTYAQGGIAGVLDAEDHFQSHVNDTLIAGGPLCDREVVQTVVEQAPQRIQELISWGTQFDRTPDGLNLGREGGHSHHRIVHALGDSTGREVMRAVIGQARQRPRTRIIEKSFTIDLLTNDSGCQGAIARINNQIYLIWAKETILCTGGAGQVFRETTNPAIATGDGHAMAWRAGVRMRDMEFMQFHPTVLYIAGGGRCLITEAVRGEGAYLTDREGRRFMQDYDERAELAPRDIVSQAIESQIAKSRDTCVYLNLRHLDPELVRERFPGMTSLCAQFNMDVTKDLIPVRPGAHYMIGGVEVDKIGRTSLAHLWAAGEVTSSGLHGANRLASNSLLEGLVYGVLTGQGASQAALGGRDQFELTGCSNPAIDNGQFQLDLVDVNNSLRSLMWRAAGVRRHGDGLQEALEQIERWVHYIDKHQFPNPKGWELQNLLQVSRTLVQSALLRTESRGVHCRSDFPALNDHDWLGHLCVQSEEIWFQPLS
ncbi:MAG: L-aspartate oxidase [Planctomycetaceae bacterium]|nr:L-aspartate oxidase [Planctomycetaceae bacterium]